MGVFAQTDIQITCKDNKTAKLVAKRIIKLTEENADDMNFKTSDVKADGEYVYLFKPSCRIQNLGYQCEELWKEVKKIDGVLEMNCPFLSEADGMYFEIDRDEENEGKYEPLPKDTLKFTKK